VNPCSPEAAQTFPQRLDLLIDKWIQVWKQVGGLKGLLEVFRSLGHPPAIIGAPRFTSCRFPCPADSTEI
jgi:hypothetical protein